MPFNKMYIDKCYYNAINHSYNCPYCGMTSSGLNLHTGYDNRYSELARSMDCINHIECKFCNESYTLVFNYSKLTRITKFIRHIGV